MSRKSVVSYKTGDLFTCPVDECLAHCVSTDMHMGKGIATKFKELFGHVEELKKQKEQTGGCAVLQVAEHRFVYYLVTKQLYHHKPTYDTLERSLCAMFDHCLQHDVTKISMPQIGAGLDKLDWKRVKDLIEKVFSGSNIEVTVYIYKPQPRR